MMVAFISWLLILATLSTLALAFSTMGEKWLRGQELKARLEAERVFRPRLIELLGQDTPDLDKVANLAPIGGRRGQTIDTLAGGLLAKLRGRDREVLQTLLRRRGAFMVAIQATHRRRPHQRIQAAELLGDGEVSAAIPELIMLLSDRDSDVRKATARAVGKLGTIDSVRLLLDALVDGRVPPTVIAMAILHVGPQSIDPLTWSLSAAASAERQMAADCLGIQGAVQSVDTLLASFESETVAIVATAEARALGRIGSPRAIPALSTCIRSDRDDATRVEAVTALGRIGGDAALDVLLQALDGYEPELERAAVYALRSAGPRGLDALRDFAEQEDSAGAHAREALDVASGRRRELVAS